MDLKETEARNDCADEGQQKFSRPTDRHDLLCKASTARGLVYSAEGRISKNMLHRQYVHLTKAKPIHKWRAHPLLTKDNDYDSEGSLEKNLVVSLKGLGAKTI
jgi:hypothetical protein